MHVSDSSSALRSTDACDKDSRRPCTEADNSNSYVDKHIDVWNKALR